MKKITLFVVSLILSLNSFSQEYVGENANVPLNNQRVEPKMALTLGAFVAGGVVGADLEALVTDHVGFQVGAGFIGYDAGITVHVKPGIRTPYFLFNYTSTGTGDMYLRGAGGSFVYRGKKWFMIALGLAVPLDVSEKMLREAYDNRQPDMLFTFSIGGYIPL